jgi:DNA invertase Pin-like site-specific DNA recombinase
VEVRSGRSRPELDRALERCREARAALLVPCLAAVGGDIAFLDALLASGVPLLSADAGAARRPTLRLLRDVARHAQATASDRSRDALRAARRRGVKLGSPRPEIGSRAGVAALRARADAHAEAIAPALRELLLSNPNASLRDLAALLEELALPTPRRGSWGPSAVRNALRRAGLVARD